MNLLHESLLGLAQERVRFMVGGGVAGILHVESGATHDLDVSVALETSDLEGLVREAAAGFSAEGTGAVESLIGPRASPGLGRGETGEDVRDEQRFWGFRHRCR